jgi:formate hydrogenlyase subunit 4
MKIFYIAVQIIIFLALAPLFEGIMRRITARVQSRQGPPLLQPYMDLFKLLGKENLDPSGYRTFHWAPMLAFASILAVIAVMPFAGKSNILSERVDIITVIYLLTMGGVSVLLGALSSRNSFAQIGASREMITMIMVEPVLAMTLIIGALKAESLTLAFAMPGNDSAFTLSMGVMLAAYLMALQAFVAKQPFDTAEAEIEILDGPFIEYSGPNYALYRYYMMLKQMFYAGLMTAVFAPFIMTGIYVLDIVIHIASTGVVFLLIALVGSTNPRFRIDQAVRFYIFLIAVSLASVGLTLTGY